MTPELGGQRSARIDRLRGLAILLVLLHHFNIAYRLDDTVLARLFGWEAVRAVARNGNYGVTMFFVISGFLITSHAGRRWGTLDAVEPRAFYAMRVARILPCLVLLLAIVHGLAWAGVAMFQNRTAAGASPAFWLVDLASLGFWMNVLLERCGWVNYPLGVLWSLSVEEVFYLAFPILCVVLRARRRLFAFWLALIVLGPAYRLAHRGDEAGFLYAYFACFDGIAIGCCTALLAGRLTLPARGLALLQGVVAVAMALLYLCWPIAQSQVLGVTAMALGTAVLLLETGDRCERPARGRMRLLRGFEWLGRRSYELYLFHLVVLGTLRTLFPPKLAGGEQKMLLLGAFFLLSAAVGAGLHRGYSEPLRRGIRRRLGL